MGRGDVHEHVCAYCSAKKTVMWRRGWIDSGDASKTPVFLCNPCGLRYKASKMPGRVPPSKKDVTGDSSVATLAGGARQAPFKAPRTRQTERRTSERPGGEAAAAETRGLPVRGGAMGGVKEKPKRKRSANANSDDTRADDPKRCRKFAALSGIAAEGITAKQTTQSSSPLPTARRTVDQVAKPPAAVNHRRSPPRKASASTAAAALLSHPGHVGIGVKQRLHGSPRKPQPLTCYSTFYFCRGSVRICDGVSSRATALQMRVYVVNKTTRVTSLAAVGVDNVKGGGRYFAYTTAHPSPFPGHSTLPEGATKDTCVRWIREICKGIKLCANPPREKHVHVKSSKKKAVSGSNSVSIGAHGRGLGISKRSAQMAKKIAGDSGTRVGVVNPQIRKRTSFNGFIEAVIPTVLSVSPSGVRRFTSYSEVQGQLSDARRTRLFYLDTDASCNWDVGSTSQTSFGTQRLLAVCGEETMKRDKHYRYTVSRELLKVAMDHAGRPFSSPPGRFKNSSEVKEWLDAVVRKSVDAGPVVMRAVMAARAAFAGNPSIRFLGQEDSEGTESEEEQDFNDDDDDDDNNEDEEENDSSEGLEASLGPVMYRWCTETADAQVIDRLSTIADRINNGVPSIVTRNGTSPRTNHHQPQSHDSSGVVKLTNRDAMNILNELDQLWSRRVNMEVLEATQIVNAVATLAMAGLSDEVAEKAQRMVLRWREKMERVVEALERRMQEMKERRHAAGTVA